MDAQLQVVALATLGSGAAAEQFEDELAKVLVNIADPNTEPDAVREITLKVKIKPSEDRSHAGVVIRCGSKLAPAKPYASLMFLSTDGRRVAAYESRPAKQQELNLDGKVKEFTGGGQA